MMYGPKPVYYDGIPLMITNVGDEHSVITLIPYGSFNAQIYYKQDNDKFYKKWNYNAITLPPNSTLSLFGDSNVFSSSSSNYANFSIVGSSVKLSGRLASISHTRGVTYTYYKLFQNCTSVVEVSSEFLEGVNIPTSGYSGDSILSYLFSNTGITQVPEGLFDFRQPINGIYACLSVYAYMFKDCKSLVSVPQNIFTKETFICQKQYQGMFSGCSSLTQAPDIYATNAPWLCCASMFSGCVSLENPPQIACNGYADTGAYESVFQDCTSLKQSPTMHDLIKDEISSRQHSNMFKNCSSLNYVKVSFTQWKIYHSSNNRLYEHTVGWLTNVSPTGTFICPKELAEATDGYYDEEGNFVKGVGRGVDTVPAGWYIDYPIIDARDGDANAMALMAVISKKTHADGTPWVKDSLVMMKSEAEKVESIKTIFAYGNCSAKDYTCMQYFVNSNFPSYCFARSKMEKVTLPNTLSTISEGTFQETLIDHINLPDSITTLLGGAFYKVKNLKSIDFNKVTKLDGYNHFYDSGLESVYIPKTLTIGSGSFRACAYLESIIVEEGHPTYDSRENCNAIILKSNNSLIAGCNTTIIPDSVKSIGGSAFNATQISYIDIPASVTSIGWGAFQNCKSLQTVILRKSTRYAINAEDFQNVPATFYVPDELLDEYKTAAVWSTFADRIKPISELPEL